MTPLSFLERIHTAVADDTVLDTDALGKLLFFWATEFDRGSSLAKPHNVNRMHVVGMALAVLAHRQSQLLHPSHSHLKELLRRSYDNIVLSDKPWAEYKLDDLQNILTALQFEFETLYTLEHDGFTTHVDVSMLCLLLLARAGHWISHKWRIPPSKDLHKVEDELLKGLVDVDSDGYASLRHETIVFFFDGLHSVCGLHSMFSRTKHIHSNEPLVELTAHHKEASAETFFIHSMTSDCVIGTVVQYKHKFAYLFHSISQTIYYNRPTYHRDRQLSLEKLLEPNVQAVYLLPLLTELHPQVPVLFEHTGAGHRPTHAQHTHSWII